jgi:hypothetical protein
MMQMNALEGEDHRRVVLARFVVDDVQIRQTLL